ncbi:hypothetical protein ACFL6C_12550 [Myxococcota bacterium]
MASVPLVTGLKSAGLYNVKYYDRGKPGLDGADIYAFAYKNRGGDCNGWMQVNLHATAVEKLLANYAKYKETHRSVNLSQALKNPPSRGVVLGGVNTYSTKFLGGG